MQEKPIFLSSYLWYYCYGKAKQFKYQLADLAPSSALRWSSVSASPSSSASASRFFPGDSSLGEKLKACQLYIANTDFSRKEAHEDCVCFVWKLVRAEEGSRKESPNLEKYFFSFLVLAATFRLRVLLASSHAWNFTRDFSTQNLKQESCQVNHSLTKVNCERLFIGFFWLQWETEHGFESFWAFEFLLNVKKSTPLWKFLRQTCFKLTIESLALMEYFSWTSSQPWLCGVLKSAKVEIRPDELVNLALVTVSLWKHHSTS